MTRRIFVSSVQRELAAEREAIVRAIASSPQLARFFSTFASATVQVELFRDRLTVFSPGPMHKDMKFEMLSEEHQSFATNPIIARALYYVQYIEEVGSGTMDIHEICARTGLRPPVFEVDARHFNVTVYRPQFDENGNRVGAQIGAEVGLLVREGATKNGRWIVRTGLQRQDLQS